MKLKICTNTGHLLAYIDVDEGIQFSTVAPCIEIREDQGHCEEVFAHNLEEDCLDQTDCGQVGFWVAAACGSGELMQWGIDGDTEYPHLSYEDAVKQVAYLMQSELHKEDTFYILNVFPNGQIRTDAVDEHVLEDFELDAIEA